MFSKVLGIFILIKAQNVLLLFSTNNIAIFFVEFIEQEFILFLFNKLFNISFFAYLTTFCFV